MQKIHILTLEICVKMIFYCLLFLGIVFPGNKLYSQVIGGGSPPSISINSPTNGYVTTSSTVEIDGTVSSAAFSSSLSVTWSNNRGGSGQVSGTYNWSINAISLQPGQNIVTVTVMESIGGGESEGTFAQVTITFVPPPTVTITTPISGQRWSNDVFLVKGVAPDFSQVGNVLYQLNDGQWASATGTTNWTAAVNLIPGTNTISAYALDTNGFSSLTNSVFIDFVVTNQLRISAVGLGQIKPDYSNAWLEVGRNYSITSAPSANFIFTNWAVLTNETEEELVNGKALQFMMRSNLLLQAFFVETSSPTLVIKTPTSNQKATNALLHMNGTTKDAWGVQSVAYQLNGGGWSQAVTTNKWTNWSATLPLISGTNKINAFSLNLGGKASPVESVNVSSTNDFKLQLSFSSTNAMTSKGLNFALKLSTGIKGNIEASTNLINWMSITNFVGTNSTINFYDSSATNYGRRFYRASVQ